MLVVVLVGALVVALVVLVSHRMLRGGSGRGTAMTDGLGNFIDVFDPARAKADRDLQSQKHQGDVLPSPDDDEEIRVRLDLDSQTARIRRSAD